MNDFRLPEGTEMGHVHLKVASLDGALRFYENLLGFHRVLRAVTPGKLSETIALSATGEPPYHFLLQQWPHARPKPPRTTGLYHVAIRFPHRRALAQVFARLLDQKYTLQGFSDHQVSEAIYLADPDGNGVELYADRPREQWSRDGDQVVMSTDPLNVQALLAEIQGDDEPWSGVDPGTHIGHVHLQVSDLARSEAFYSGVLGLEVTQRNYPGALFLAAGGYHHHVGLNVWAGIGAPPPPTEATGLKSFALRIPNETVRRALLERCAAAGFDFADRETEQGSSAMVVDPDGISVELMAGPDEIRGNPEHKMGEALQA